MPGILELFGYSPDDQFPAAQQGRSTIQCPFIGRHCAKTLRDGRISGVCIVNSARSGPVICCSIRLLANDYQILTDVANIAFGPSLPLVPAREMRSAAGDHIVVFGKQWGELELSTGGGKRPHQFDWVLAHINASGQLAEFVTVDVPTIPTRGQYKEELAAFMERQAVMVRSTAQPNWEQVNAILSRLIYKGHVLGQEPLCLKGLFVVCHVPVYQKMLERLGGRLPTYPLQPGTITFLPYTLGPPVPMGRSRDLESSGRLTTTIEHVALAFSAPRRTPPPRSYENAIRTQLF